MAAKASMRTGYVARLIIIGLMFLIFGMFFLYDAMIRYPQKQFMHEEYLRFQKEYKEDFGSRWSEYALEKGWPVVIGNEKPKTDMDITTQYIFFVICMAIAVPFLIAYIRSRGKWIATDEKGISTNRGVTVFWDQIESLDRSRWKSKGIAVVHYAGDGGVNSRVTLDDWKYETEPIRQIVTEIEQHLGLSDPAEQSDSDESSVSSDEPQTSDISA